jgi:hypothetical protein
MAIQLGDNIKLGLALPTDARYYSTATNKPWTGVTEVNTKLLGGVGGVRYTGLTVNVAGVEYWYKEGIADGNLIIKSMGGGTLTGATNGIYLTGSNTKVALGGDLNGDVYFSGGTLKYSTHPSFSGDTQIVDKRYVDDIATGLKPKEAVKVATTGYTNLASPPSFIDGVAMVNMDRVLIKNQGVGNTGSTQNGIYNWHSSGMTRSSDFDGTPASETVSGAYVWVLTGNTNENTAWVLDTPDPIIITGVTPTSLSFVVFANVADVVGLSGVTVSMNTGVHNVYLDSTAYWIRNYGITGATNGLNNTGTTRTIKLGGELTKHTIVGTDNYSMSICNTSNAGLLIESGSTPSSFLGGLTYVLAEEATGSISLWADSGGTTVNALTHVGLCGTLPTSAYAESVVYSDTLSRCSGHNLEIDRFEIYSCNNPLFSGATYNCDFSSKFVSLSLPHVGWVRSQITGASTNAITGATNGLYAFSNHCVCLGGTLTTPVTFVGSNANHLQYNGNYCAGFVARSIPDVAYVTGYTAQKSNIVSTYNQAATGNYSASTSTEFVGAFTGSSIFLPPVPSLGQRISVVDWNGGAFVNNIIVCSTTFPILNASYATINSDYGSITFIFNGTFWSAIAYV